MANEKDLNKVEETKVEEVAVDSSIQEEVEKELAKKKEEIKNLTLTELRKKDRALNSQTEHEIVVKTPKGVDKESDKVIYEYNTYKVKIDDVFRKTKQHRLLEDLINFLNEGSKRVEILDVATPYISLLLIKHFTSLEIPNDIDKALEMMDILTDLEIFSKLISLMPEDEVLKMYESISASVDRMNHNIDEMVEEAKRVSEDAENDEVKEMLEDGTEK